MNRETKLKTFKKELEELLIMKAYYKIEKFISNEL